MYDYNNKIELRETVPAWSENWLFPVTPSFQLKGGKRWQRIGSPGWNGKGRSRRKNRIY